jgi:hypothetical protein
MVVRGRSTKRGKDQRGTSRSKSRGKKGKKKCWFCGKSGHLKKDCLGKDKNHPKRTPQRKQRKLIQLKQVHVQVKVWLMRYYVLVMFHNNIYIRC